MCDVAANAQHLLGGGHHNGSTAFAADPVIVSDLVYLDDAPKGEDVRPREEETLGSANGVGDVVCRKRSS